jgi:hypothetical protein
VTTPAPGSPWPDDLVRVFLSHAALHKDFVGDVAAHLRGFGAYGFVAHETMAFTLPWQGQIEHALATADALVALVHPEVNDSAWCQQEIGWAYGRQIPVLCVRMGATPTGFPSSVQWPSGDDGAPDAVARTIGEWLNKQPALADRIAGGLIKALGRAGNYYDARDAARALDRVGTLTPEQWEAVDRIVRTNDQVGGSIWAREALSPLFARAGREIPRYTG